MDPFPCQHTQISLSFLMTARDSILWVHHDWVMNPSLMDAQVILQ